MSYKVQNNFTFPQQPTSNTLHSSDMTTNYKVKGTPISEEQSIDSPSSTQCAEEWSQSSETMPNLRATRINSSPVEANPNSPVLGRKGSVFSDGHKVSDSEELSIKEEDLEEGQDSDLPFTTEWPDKQDKILKNLATKCKYDWKKIAKKFNARQNSNYEATFLQHKYKQITRPTMPLRVKFTKQEDLMIAKYFEMYGCDWAKIAGFFTDRTAIMLKNRYYSHIRKRDLLSSLLEEVKDDSQDEEVITESIKVEEEVVNVNLPEVAPTVIYHGNFEPNVDFHQNNFESEFRFLDFNTDHYRFEPFFDMERELRSELNEKVTVNFYL